MDQRVRVKWKPEGSPLAQDARHSIEKSVPASRGWTREHCKSQPAHHSLRVPACHPALCWFFVLWTSLSACQKQLLPLDLYTSGWVQWPANNKMTHSYFGLPCCRILEYFAPYLLRRAQHASSKKRPRCIRVHARGGGLWQGGVVVCSGVFLLLAGAAQSTEPAGERSAMRICVVWPVSPESYNPGACTREGQVPETTEQM
jgi:hypothetical protein